MTLDIFECFRECKNGSEDKCVLKNVSPISPTSMCNENQHKPVEHTTSPIVPLEEALNIAGVGLYTYYVMVVSGLVIFSALLAMQAMAIIIPVAGCELRLSSYQKGLITSIPFVGMLFSSFVFGYLADAFGRRRVMLWCSGANAVLAILASLSKNDVILLVIWFANGFLLGGVFSTAWVYVMEFCPRQIRARSILVPACLSSLAQIYLPYLAWLILPLEIAVPLPLGVVFTPWRLYLALIAVPTAITWTMLYQLPETPKFTLNRGNENKALKILRSIYAVNNHRKKEDYSVKYLCLDLDDMMASQNKTERDESCVSVLRSLFKDIYRLFTSPLLPYTLLSIAILFQVVGAYNTLYLWYPEQMRILMLKYNFEMDYNATLCDVMSAHSQELSDGVSGCDVDQDIFVITMITALLQSSLFLIISLIADRVGKKLLMMLFGALSSGFCIGLIYANTFLLTVSTLSLTVITLSVIFPISYGILLEYFPTSLRSTAASLTMAFARFGSAGGSQIFGALFENNCVHAYWSLSAVLISTVLISIVMPTKRIPQ